MDDHDVPVLVARQDVDQAIDALYYRHAHYCSSQDDGCSAVIDRLSAAVVAAATDDA